MSFLEKIIWTPARVILYRRITCMSVRVRVIFNFLKWLDISEEHNLTNIFAVVSSNCMAVSDWSCQFASPWLSFKWFKYLTYELWTYGHHKLYLIDTVISLLLHRDRCSVHPPRTMSIQPGQSLAYQLVSALIGPMYHIMKFTYHMPK
jgi:hypothetical protein